jgi:hypothetical protein
MQHDYRSRPRRCQATAGSNPSVTLVIPIRNERGNLEALWGDLLAQTYPAIGSVVFVDGLSTDGTSEALAALARSDRRVVVRRNQGRLPAAGLNLVLPEIRTDLVMRLDAHARYAPDVVAESVRILLETGAAGVGPVAIPDEPDGPVGRAIVCVHHSPLGVGAARFRRAGAEGWTDTIWNGCYWTHVVRSVGPWREDLPRAEDNDFNERVRRLGYGLYVSPAIRARYQTRRSLDGLARQYAATGIGVVRGLAANPGAFGLRHLVPLAFVSALLVPTVVALLWPPAFLASIGILLLYLAVVAAAAVHAARAGLGVHLLFMPVTFATLHLSYGLGSLWGVLLLLRERAAAHLRRRLDLLPRD